MLVEKLLKESKESVSDQAVPPLERAVLCDLNRYAVKRISEAPTLDVQLVRRGEWKYLIYQTDKTAWIMGEFICCKCGKCIPWQIGDNPPDYCQHCGADMKKEEHHE